MKILKLTAKNFKKSDSYYSNYVGEEIPIGFDGSIEIEANLGWVRFKDSVSVKGSIIALAGSGIEAGEGIKAGKP